jgi:anti-sigma28 factor (negative regulator of flagellin synthesis)
MDLPSVPQRGLDEFLFQLPNQPLAREERLRLIKQAIADGTLVTQEHVDRVMARLLEELQRTS